MQEFTRILVVPSHPMAYSAELANRLDAVLANIDRVERKKMFGGLAYMVNGHMCVGILEDRLIARVGPTAYEDYLALPHARAMDFTGRPMTGLIYVDSPGIDSDADLKRWVNRCLRFVESLPAKKSKR